MVGVVTLVLVEPGVIGLFEPILLGIDHSQAFSRIDVILDKLVTMSKSCLVLQRHRGVQGVFFFILRLTHDFSDIVSSLTVDPGTAEQTRALTFHLTDDLAAVDAIVNQGVLRGLTVADLTRVELYFRQITHSRLLCGALVLALSSFSRFISANLDLLGGSLVLSLRLDSLNELIDESFHILAGKVHEAR